MLYQILKNAYFSNKSEKKDQNRTEQNRTEKNIIKAFQINRKKKNKY